jgi:hypothetical protein
MKKTAKCQSRVQPVPKSNVEHNDSSVSIKAGLLRISFLIRNGGAPRALCQQADRVVGLAFRLNRLALALRAAQQENVVSGWT